MTDTTQTETTTAGVRASVNGLATDAKGRIEDAVGGITGDLKLQAKGKMDEAKGIVEQEVGKVLLPANEKI